MFMKIETEIRTLEDVSILEWLFSVSILWMILHGIHYSY